jgi:pyruvate dehydrogenase E1 component
LNIPPISILDELLKGSGDRDFSTTMAFVRILAILSKDKDIGAHIVPIIPDEARTFGIDPLFRQLGIYSHVGQVYDPVDSDQFLYYREAADGQILEEGINEAGAISSFIAAGTAYSSHSINMIPFFIYYSMFGFQRVGDFIWAAADMRTKGFLLGGTAGRTTLAGEGLQHQDGHSHLMASVVPNMKAYDPAFAYEIAVIIHDGLKRMYVEQEDVFYYLTLENENYTHPPITENVEEGIIKGMYLLKKGEDGDNPKVQLLASGSMVHEILEAAALLKQDWNIDADVYSVTSFSELHREAEDKNRWNILHPHDEDKISYVGSCLKQERGPVVAVSDYVKLVAEQIAPYIDCPFVALGTDGFGRSETREELRRFFEINRYYIIMTALESLSNTGQMEKNKVQEAIEKYKLNTEKPNPITV